MSSKIRFDLSIPTSAATFDARCKLVPGRSGQSLTNIGNYFEAIGGGPYAGSCLVSSGAVMAQGKVTITSTGPTDGETMTVGNVTITAKTSGAVPAEGEFDINASATIVATGMALAINSVPELAGVVTASSLAGVVTITAAVPGAIGNGIDLTEAMTNVAITNAMGSLTAGTDGTQTTVSNGY